MKITENDVDKIASLAQLEFDAESKKAVTEQLRNILAYIEKLNELDTTKTEPTSHVFPLKNVFRDDSTKRIFDVESSFQNAPQFDKDHYQVPKIIE